MNNFKVTDHSVSKEVFELLYNQELDMLVTSPQPSEEELGKYYESEDYISHTDAKRNLIEKVYHLVRNYSLKKKLNLINEYSGEKQLLDIGCGTGDFLEVAKNNKWKVTGIEPNEQARAIANSKTGNAVYNIDNLLTFEEQSFDVIT
ncbi:MAG: class I SAM-dependent methyltransferase, partial [Flavobacteriaceae bacterium]|nr:class I SAM-dependent methyltransferase [Flavobacteriaceae bacterium]